MSFIYKDKLLAEELPANASCTEGQRRRIECHLNKDDEASDQQVHPEAILIAGILALSSINALWLLLA